MGGKERKMAMVRGFIGSHETVFCFLSILSMAEERLKQSSSLSIGLVCMSDLRTHSIGCDELIYMMSPAFTAALVLLRSHARVSFGQSDLAGQPFLLARGATIPILLLAVQSGGTAWSKEGCSSAGGIQQEHRDTSWCTSKHLT